MAQDNLTTLDALLKNVYLPGLPEAINTQRPLWGRIEKITKKERFRGRNFTFALKTANEQGTGQLSESETLPVGVATSILNFTLTMKYYYGVAKISAQIASAAQSDIGAFQDAVSTALDGVKDTMTDDMAVDTMFGDGSGTRGTVSAYSSTTLTMKDQPTVGEFGTRLIRQGMLLSSYTAKSGGSQGANAVSVASILSTTTANVGASAGFSANDIVFRAVTAGTDPRNKSMMGLGGIVDDATRVTTIQNLSRSTYPILKANVLGNSGTLRAWTPELMDQLSMEAWLNGCGVYPTAFYSPLEIQRRAAAYIRADRMFDMSVKTYDGGYKAIEWTSPGGQAPWFVDRFCIPNEVHAVYEPDLFMAIQEDVQPENQDGGMWRFTGRTHDREAWFFTFRNLGSRRFNSHTALKDVSHTL